MIPLFLIVLLASTVSAWLQTRIVRHTGRISGAGGTPVILGLLSLGVFGWAITEIEQRSIVAILLLGFAYLFGIVVAGVFLIRRKKDT